MVKSCVEGKIQGRISDGKTKKKKKKKADTALL